MKAKTVAKHFTRYQEAKNTLSIYETLVRSVKKDQHHMEKAKRLTDAFWPWACHHSMDYYQAEAQVRQCTAALTTIDTRGDGYEWYEVEGGVLGISSVWYRAFLIPHGEKLPPVIPTQRSFMTISAEIERMDPHAESWHERDNRRIRGTTDGGDNVIPLFR